VSLFAVLPLYSQITTRIISGTVTSYEESTPIEGVSVHIKGSNKNSGTQADGVFYIRVTEKDSALVFSYDNFKTEEVKICSSNEYNVALKKALQTPPSTTGFTSVNNLSGLFDLNLAEKMPLNSPINSSSTKTAFTTIKGNVLFENTSTAVPKVYLYIVEGEEEALTDINGNFSIQTWQNLPVNLTIKYKDNPSFRIKISDPSKTHTIWIKNK
jgi:hypothetical protein